MSDQLICFYVFLKCLISITQTWHHIPQITNFLLINQLLFTDSLSNKYTYQYKQEHIHNDDEVKSN